MKYIIIDCPHCKHNIVINNNEINCKIFRHGTYKDSFLQIDPHLDKENCDKLFDDGKIYGCGKPFELVEQNDTYVPIKCEYK
jgi:DNA-directed RNA polymerase subunit RPC12/RpoP